MVLDVLEENFQKMSRHSKIIQYGNLVSASIPNLIKKI